ncbi:fatty acyl-AMP ligase [Nocardia brasiliensis]|nr:fatty acyl-AMP ligase [Nocardia brasiliensis]
MSTPNSIVDILIERSESDDPGYLFLSDGTVESEQRISFRECGKRADEYAAALYAGGVRAGDRVVLASSPGLHYIAALYGVLSIGAVVVPCYPPLRGKDVERFRALLAAAPVAVIIDEIFEHRVRELAALDCDRPAPSIVTGRQLEQGASVPRVHARPDSLALIQYTSGSTGSPKGVAITHANLVSNCRVLGRNMGDDPERVGVSWLPPYHDMGLIGTIILSMFYGWPLVTMSPLHFVQRPLRWLTALTHYGATTTVGPNFALDLCAESVRDAELDELDLSRVRHLYCGAEPVRSGTLTRFVKRFGDCGLDPDAIIPCYGLAEATLFISGRRKGQPLRLSGAGHDAVVSCGVVDQEHRVRIVDPTSLREQPQGDVGEIWVSGRNVAAGYHGDAASTAVAFAASLHGGDENYLRTGDLGFIEQGELYVRGRIKDVIVINARNIFPSDIELLVTGLDQNFRRAAAVSLEGARGEELGVLVEFDGAGLDERSHKRLTTEVRANIATAFGLRLAHFAIVAKGAIPTTTSGKVRRYEVRRLLSNTDLLAPKLQPIRQREVRL